MDLDSSLVLDLWELVVEHIPTSKKEDVANKLVMIFADKGLDSSDFDAIRGEDNHLDLAIDNFFEADRDVEEFDYESNDYDTD